MASTAISAQGTVLSIGTGTGSSKAITGMALDIRITLLASQGLNEG
jgi:hypothetical protein